MIAYLLLLLCITLSTVNRAVNKWVGASFTSNRTHLTAFHLITAPIAILFLSATAGFHIQLNGTTCVYAAVFAFICAVSPIVSILAMQSAGVSFVGILSSAGSLVVSTLFGLIYYHEPCKLTTILPVILMLIAVILPSRYLTSSDHPGKINGKSIFLCIAVFLFCGMSSILSKLFAMDTRVTDANSYFVLTNVFVFIIACVTWILQLKKDSPVKNPFQCFPKKQVISLVGTVVLSNVVSLLTVIVLANMHVSLYSVLSAAGLVIFGLLLSKLFKEKLTKENYISCILAILAAIINVWDQLYLLVIG